MQIHTQLREMLKANSYPTNKVFKEHFWVAINGDFFMIFLMSLDRCLYEKPILQNEPSANDLFQASGMGL